MVGIKDTSIGNGEERILRSSYPDVVAPALATYSAAEYILSRNRENMKNGLTHWIVRNKKRTRIPCVLRQSAAIIFFHKIDSITGFTVTQQDVEPLSRSVASAFVKRGMVKGDAVLYLTSDVTKVYAVVLGVWRVGGVMHSAYPVDSYDTLHTRLQECKAKWILCDPPSLPQTKKAVELLDWAVEIFVFGEAEGCTSVEELFSDDGEACPAAVPAPQLSDPLLVLVTSGTTGRSKGAVYTNKTILGFCFGSAGFPHSPIAALFISRCTHVLGALFPLRNACIGGKLVMMSEISIKNVFDGITKYKPFFVYGFPTILMQIVLDLEAEKTDRSCLECICVGGMILPTNFHSVMRTLPNIKEIMVGYSLTECAALATTMQLGINSFKAIPNHPPQSVGRLYPNTALKVVDMDTGESLGPGETGELFFRSPMIVAGYWNSPEDMKDTFVDGWVRTGDLGYYDEDGYVFVVDRVKDTFKYFGNQICPAELEAEILNHPAVAVTCVFGVVDPNGGDNIPRAVVVLKEGVTATADEIKKFANSRLADYKTLRGGLYIVESLPLGKTDKVDRLILRKTIFS